MSGFAITLPYAIYRIPVQDPWERKPSILLVSLAKNAQLRMGDRNQALVREAKRQMRQDAGALMLAASWPEMRLPLVMDAEITTRTAVRKDDDGAVVGLYPVRDQIASSLGVNDSEIRIGKIEFRKGASESSTITITGA